MSDWVLVPSLVVLRTEFNTVAPARRKGADGSIGDSNHSSSSDHTPDEDSDILRDHDADSKNEVHALDIDSAGPWPGGAAWFDRAIHAIVAREKAAGSGARLQYVIWNRQIANREVDNWRWRTYKGSSDPHTNHAHFSSRYTTAAESNTAPWGLVIEGEFVELDDLMWEKGKEPDSWTDRFTAAPTVRNALAFAAYDAHDAEKLGNANAAKLGEISAVLARLALPAGADPDAAAADIARRISNG